jgi:hypothetical protein
MTKKRQFSLYSVFVALLVFAAAFSAIRLIVQSAKRERERHIVRQFWLIYSMLDGYEYAYGRLPRDYTAADGRRLNSWRLQILPFGEQPPMWGHVDRTLPWQSYAVPGVAVNVDYPFAEILKSTSMETKIVAVSGPGTAFDALRDTRLSELDDDVILATETRRSGVPWMAPGDLNVAEAPRAVDVDNGFSGNLAGGFHVLFADGSIWRLSNETPFAALEKFLYVESARRHDREALLRPYCLDPN